MKTLIAFIFLMLPLFLFAQHKTLKDSNGDPLTEIIDPNSMKQGDWIYYDNNDQVIRREVFKDNELQSRLSIVNGKELNTTNYEVDGGLKSLIASNIVIDGITFSGELVINEKGEIVKISFYNLLESKMEDFLLKEITNIVVEKFNGRTNLILTF